MNIQATRTVGVCGHGGIVAFLVGDVRGGVFLLLECNGEAEITVFLGEAGVIEASNGGGASTAYAGAAAIVYGNLVRI